MYVYDDVPPTPATHWENVLAELQAKVPGIQGPVRRVAEADAEADVEVTVIIVLLKTGEVVVKFENVVEGESSNELVFEKGCNCEDVEDELPRHVVLENIG
jgi:hypothetical protein